MPALAQLHPKQPVEEFEVPLSVAYNWEYDTPRRRLSRLYENAKRDQWNSTDRLDWSIDVDPEKGLVPDAGIGIYGTPIWERLDEKQIQHLRKEAITWQLSQFLHGEQGALLATATCPLLRDLTAAVMEDESRHVAFGVLSLREFYEDLSEAERTEREEFVYEACVLMRDRISNREVWEAVGLDPEECIEEADKSELSKNFRYRLFSKIVPNVKSLGLLSEKQRKRFHELEILQYETGTTSDVDQDIEEERRVRAGEIAAPA
jgi:hypothetical protein